MLGTLGGYVYLSKGTNEIPQLLELSDSNVIMCALGFFFICDLETSKILILSAETLEFIDFLALKSPVLLQRGKFQWVCGTQK